MGILPIEKVLVRAGHIVRATQGYGFTFHPTEGALELYFLGH